MKTTTNYLKIGKQVIVSGLVLLFIAGFSSCRKKAGCTDPGATNYDPEAEKYDGSCDYDFSYEVPATYNFENVKYTGQTVRILLLKDLITEIASESATSSTLNDIYQNTSGKYSDIGSANLEQKVANQADKDSIQSWFNQIDALGGKFLNKDSIDLKQMIEKTLMGSVIYNRALNDYLDGLGDDDNSVVETGKGTEMEHHFDEAFGYFGAAMDYNNYTDSEIKSTGEKDANGDGSIDPGSEKCFYYALTAAKRDLGAADFSASGQTDFTRALFDAFLKGRAAISNQDYSTRDEQVSIIKENWEKIIAATVVHYINDTKSDISAADHQKRYVHWAEMKAYFHMLSYNSQNKLGANYSTVNDLLGTNPTEADAAKLDEAAGYLKTAYGFTSEQISGW